MKRYIKADSFTYTIQDIKQKIEDLLKIYMKFVNYDSVDSLFIDSIGDSEKESAWNVDVQPYTDTQVMANVHAEIQSTEDMYDLMNKLDDIIIKFDETAFFTMKDPFDLFAIINI